MINDIKTCHKCNLCANQSPLLDNVKNANIMVVGLSAKIKHNSTEIPLDRRTRSGSLVSELEEIAQNYGYNFYRTNLIKCVPLDVNGKLRYPTEEEIDLCFKNLVIEMDYIKPQIVILFGGIVVDAFANQLRLCFSKSSIQTYRFQKMDGRYYIPMYHPSYVLRSKARKDIYINNFVRLIQDLL